MQKPPIKAARGIKMKGVICVALLCAAGPISAHNAPLNVENFSTFKSDQLIKTSGWTELGSGDGTKAWYVHAESTLDRVGIAVKIATKGIGDYYATVEVDTAFVNCSDVPQGKFPIHIHALSVEIFDVQTGNTISGSEVEPVADMVPIRGGTFMGEAVKQSCDHAVKEYALNHADDAKLKAYALAIQDRINAHWPDLPSPWPNKCPVEIYQANGGKITSAKVIDGCGVSKADASIMEAYLTELTLPYAGYEALFKHNLTISPGAHDH
jgi:hypothetical protein